MTTYSNSFPFRCVCPAPQIKIFVQYDVPLILEPSEKGASFSVMVATVTYAVELHNVNKRETAQADTLAVGNSTSTSVTALFEVSGLAVLYLKKIEP